ncbi:MAG: transglutaminase-like domain-containing protein [Clostridiales Family XIII bacterium]|nr:transglutaminase-like domain-containing protein [Clostridiales Family XIII bacterium]
MITSLVAMTGCSGKISEIKDSVTGGGDGKQSVKEDPNAPDRDVTPVVNEVNAPGTAAVRGDGGTIDYSNVSAGYIMASYSGNNPKVKLQIKKSDGELYTYDLKVDGSMEAFPLSEGDGSYTVQMFFNVSGDSYMPGPQAAFDATFDQFSPYLRPNQYVYYTPQSKAITKAAEICKGSKSDLGALEKLFIFVTENVKYDYDEAANVQAGYLPDIDETLETGKGICFDYASLLSAMSRSQRIPTKLVVGYAGEAYHAWISVYLKDIGWVDNIIEFHGDEWTMMDPTFVASGDDADPNKVGDGQNYNPMYYY